MKSRGQFLTWVLCLGFLLGGRGLSAEVTSVRLNFYSQEVTLYYNSAMLMRDPARLDEKSLEAAYRHIARQGGDVLHSSLTAERQRLQLNDFLYYRLLRQSVGYLYGQRSPQAQEITIFYLLVRAGFDARLTFRQNRLYVNVYTREKIFEVPLIEDAGRSYANISCMDGSCAGRQSLYLSELRPNPQGRAFSFRFTQWPRLPARPRERTVSFAFRGRTYKLPVKYDGTVVEILRDYPLVDEYYYLESPLSPTLRNSLLPQLRRLMAGLDQRSALELLVTFTRSAFQYKEDSQYFGRSKPMVSEELFDYAYSDCEDRTALFYGIVRELFGLPMAVVAYDDHLTLGISTPQITGDGFNYQGRRYVFCDPTGPANSSMIGEVPPGYEKRSFQVIGTSK